MSKPTGTQAAKGVPAPQRKQTSPAPAATPAAASKGPVLREPLARNTRGWGFTGGIIAASGLLVAVYVLGGHGLADVRAADPQDGGLAIAEAAAWVQGGALALAIGAIGIAMVVASQKEMRCGAAGNLMVWAGGAMALVWMLAAMSLATSASLAVDWAHLSGATAAFATANIIAGAPMGLLLLTYAGASACVYARHKQPAGLALAAVAALLATGLGIAAYAGVDAVAGSVSILTAGWALVAGVLLLVHKGRPISGR